MLPIAPPCRGDPPRDRGPVLKRVATDLQTEQTKLWINPVCRLVWGDFWGSGIPFWFVLQGEEVAGEQRVQQEPTNTRAYFMATDGVFLPSAKYFTPYQRLCFLYLKFIRGHWR